MADPTDTNPDLKKALAAGGIESDDAPKDEAYQPIYKMVTENKIPVSKKMGPFWRARKDIGMQRRKDVELAWKECVRYYNHDQLYHRTSRMYGSGNTVNNNKMSDTWSETENVVYANTSTMLPLLYSKNPQVEFTATNEDNKDMATMYKHLVNALLAKREAPGANLKAAARRAILHTLLTNEGWLKIGWTQKQESNEAAMKTLQDLSKQLSEAKTIQDIQRVEGDIQALEGTIDLLTPAGLTRKVISPFNMLVDPDSIDPDLMDCNWLMECDMLPTAYIKAKFAKKNGDDKDVSIYDPTHVMKIGGKVGGGEGTEDDVTNDVNNFTLALGAADQDVKSYGYADNDTFQSALMTKVWYVWDKTTRRVYMFNDKDWTWPIWVWNDPLKLLRFFPYFRLHFHEVFEGTNGRGEVTYYLDQQDAINDINSEMHRARAWIKRNVFFDKAAGNKDDIEAVLKGTDGTARGIHVPEGKTLDQMFWVPVPPALKFPQLFDTASKYAAIDRLSSVSSVMRGEQFKTNTTNDAVQSYNQAAAVRSDEKTDAIEDWLGEFAYSVAQLCSQFMEAEDVAALIGESYAENWKTTDSDDFRTKLSMTVVGGSTQKPTSANKKQEALQMGQVLGQFVKASPAVIMVLLKVFEQAFDEVTITDQDWKMLQQSVEQAMQAQQQQPGQGEGGDGGNPLEQMIQSLPPEAQQALKAAIDKGVPPMTALNLVLHHMQGQPGEQSAAPAQGEQPK